MGPNGTMTVTNGIVRTLTAPQGTTVTMMMIYGVVQFGLWRYR